MDVGTLILIAIIVIAVVMLVRRLMAQQQNPYSQQGSNRPQYNDPNVSSHGGFGGSNQPQQQGPSRPQYDDPNVESHGGFGPSGGSNSNVNLRQQGQSRDPYEANKRIVSEKAPESTRKNDDPHIESHGGFGGQK